MKVGRITIATAVPAQKSTVQIVLPNSLVQSLQDLRQEVHTSGRRWPFPISPVLTCPTTRAATGATAATTATFPMVDSHSVRASDPTPAPSPGHTRGTGIASSRTAMVRQTTVPDRRRRQITSITNYHHHRTIAIMEPPMPFSAAAFAKEPWMVITAVAAITKKVVVPDE